MSVVLALWALAGTAQAQEEAAEPAAVEEAAQSSEASESTEIPWKTPEGAAVEPSDVEAELLPEPAAEAPDAEASAEPGLLGYQDGYVQGQTDAGAAGDYGLHGLAGFAGGCLIGPCGCVAVPAFEAVISPGVPAGAWQSYETEYQKGYIDGYRREVQRRRVIYSLVGASVGTVVGVGAGLAFGAMI